MFDESSGENLCVTRLFLLCQILYAPTLGLSEKTEIYMTEKLRPGPFSMGPRKMHFVENQISLIGFEKFDISLKGIF